MLSVCIVNWNTRDRLRACLRSLQEWPPQTAMEVVVVDNASTDGSAEMVRAEFPQVTLLANQDNRGYAEGNNQGIAASRGEYVMLLNPDTEVIPPSRPGAPHPFDVLVGFLEQHPEAGAVAPQLVSPDGSVQRSCRSFPTPGALLWEFLGASRLFPASRRLGAYRMTYWDHRSCREVDQPMGSCLVLRRQALDEVGVFDPQFRIFFNEVDLCYRLKRAGWRIYFTPQAAILHYGGESTRQVRLAMIRESGEALQRFYRKHYRDSLSPLSYRLALAAIRGAYALRYGSAWLREKMPRLPAFRFPFSISPLLSGLLLFLCFQFPSLSFLVFFAVAPLLYSLCQGGGFRRGWGAGIAFFLPLLTWLRPIPFGELAWLMSSLYMSLYLALFGAAFAWIRRRRGVEVALLTSPLVWVLIEYLRSFGPLGFTWGSVAHALWAATPLLQIADLTGYYGVSFLVLLVNAAWVAWRLNLRRAPELLAAGVLLWGGTVGYGLFRGATVEETAGLPWRVGVAQGNVEELDETAPTPEARLKGRWQPHLQERNLHRYLELSQQALEQGARVLIWPETALPMRLTSPEWAAMRLSLSEFTRDQKVWLLLGSVDSVGEDTIYNTAFIYNDQGRLVDRYHKTHLVVFGEFTPFVKQLPFMRVFAVRDVGYTHGEGFHLVHLNGQPIGTPICFESTFSQIVRRFVRLGAKLICIITNDAWFDGTVGPAQHAAMGVFRAIENRRWVIQAANTGVTGIITPQGRFLRRLPEREPGVIVDTVYLCENQPFYLRFGDVFMGLCGMALVGWVGGIGFLEKRRPPPPTARPRRRRRAGGPPGPPGGR